MLIYNHKKEFFGIDEDDLQTLGFSNLGELRAETSDFADLFVKSPGFVHNFKHVHWIDFITCAESSEDAKVIIHANGKSFKSILDVKTTYLVDNPTEKAFLINLVNLRELTHNENDQVASDILERPTPKAPIKTNTINKTPVEEKVEVAHDPYETTTEETISDVKPNLNIIKDDYEDISIDLEDNYLELDEIEDNFTEDKVETETLPQESTPSEQEPVTATQPVIEAQILNVGVDYRYNPQVASDELGLPVDLIEEFIEDFISQAHEFKDDLYIALNEDDFDNVKILSHKLKGVAANLRIEDALEVLTTINTSDDFDVIKMNMDTFYLLIDKLSGKTPHAEKIVEEEDTQLELVNDEDDDLILSFKDIEEEPNLELDELQELKIEEEPNIEAEEIVELETQENSDDFEFNYNKTTVANEIGIDSQSFDELFKDYLVEGENSCIAIDKAIEENNSDLWRNIALKFKGMSDNMRIHDYVEELESIIHTQDTQIAKLALEQISAKLNVISSKEL